MTEEDLMLTDGLEVDENTGEIKELGKYKKDENRSKIFEGEKE
jgi:hypothetical protein